MFATVARPTSGRQCEVCGGAMPNRTHRQRDSKGRLACDSCKEMNMPEWSTTHSSLSLIDQSEMRRREAEAISAIARVNRIRREGHDSGDNAILNHCPFCGSGAIVAGSDGSVECDFCHTSFTVQVQPAHPNMPQTVDGQPLTPPGMPGGDETEMSAPSDPAVEESDEGVASDPLGGDEAAPGSNGPVAPGAPPSKQPGAPDKADPATNPGKGEDGKDDGDGKKKSLPPWMKHKKTMRTQAGQALDPEAYMAHLALNFADDRTLVLDAVRLANMTREADEERNEDLDRLAHGVDCPRCQAYADTPCKTRRGGNETKPHSERIDRAVRLHQKRKESSSGKVTCPNCHGDAEIDTGKREHDTGAPVTRTCPTCDGSGEVFPSVAAAYDTHDGHQGSMRPFEAAGGLTKHEVKATEIKVGDYLDIMGRNRVHTVHPRGERVLVGFRGKGTRSGSTRAHHQDEAVTVWRRP